MKIKSLFFIVAILLPVLWLFAQDQTAPKEESLPEEAQQQNWSQSFQEAEKAFNSDNPSASITMFQDLIGQITEQKLKRELSQPEQLMLWKSLDYLGQAFFNEGQTEQSKTVFLKLVELNANYKLNEDLVSPKIIDFVSQIKAQNMGTVSINSTPPGASVKLDGVAVGVTDLASVFSLKGDHDIEISKPGFVTHRETINVTPGRSQKVTVTLERTSSVGYFITYPKGVEVYLGSKLLGVTAGTPNDRAQRAATASNLNAADFSGEFAVPDLAPGTYDLEFRKACWETQKRRVTIDKNDDYLFEPIILATSFAYLNVTADDPQATILLDNDYVGAAPKQKYQICSGKHVLKVKGPRGKYEKQIDPKKDEVLTIAAKLNPSLAFMGIVGAKDVQKTDVDTLTVETVKQLSGLQNLNFVDNSGGDDRAATDAAINAIIEGVSSNTPDKDRKQKIQELCNKVESDLLLVGFAPKERLQRTVRFFLLSNWSSMADLREIQVFDAAEWKTFRDQLEYEEPLFQKRLGLSLIDTTITQGPVVAQILLKTFTDSQPILPGDVVIAINGSQVKSAAQALSLVRTTQPDQVTLTVLRAGQSVNIPIKPVNSPMEIRFDNPGLLFNRQILTFEKDASSANPLEKNLALLNVGLCHMHFAEFDDAFADLRQVQLDRSLGIGQGTVQYRIALCYRELGYLQESKDSLTDAERYKQNTIYSDDGPSLTREIDRAQKALQ